MTEAQDEAMEQIAALFATLNKGLYDRDAEAITELYLPGAIIYDLAPPLVDKPDEAQLALWLSSWAGPVKRTTRDVEILVMGNRAVMHGLTNMRTTTQEGELAAWWMRTTMILEHRDNGWKIAHEHNSVPFYMDGAFPAALDLEPESA